MCKTTNPVEYLTGIADLSHSPPDAPLAESVVDRKEPFRIIGAMVGR